ncbi:MAG: hypothetical protein Fur0032_13280 [Terrimicrobiaceae bacterium]
MIYFAAGCGDLWFDEVLSLQWAKSARSPWDLLLTFKHDNNHPLNTAWLAMVGVGQSPWLLRSLSMAAGVGSVWLLYRIARRLIPAVALAAVLVFAFSYSSVLYFSEARGYAPAVLCCLVLFELIENGGDRWFVVLLFWLVAVLGLLSHATVVYPLVALGVFQAARSLHARLAAGKVFARLAVWFAIPAAAAGILYLTFWKPMMIAGGPGSSSWEIAADFFAYTFGFPLGGGWGLPIVLLSATWLFAGWFLGPWPPGARSFFTVLVLAPMAVLWVTRPEYVAFRYFLVVTPFLVILAFGCFAGLAEHGPVWRWLAWLVVALSLATQAPRVAALIVHGRGTSTAALDYIVQNGGGDIFSDHDMLVGMVVEDLRGRNPGYQPLHYHPQWASAAIPPRWLILHTQKGRPQPPEETVSAVGAIYRFEETFPSAPVSGATWQVYRRVDTP